MAVEHVVKANLEHLSRYRRRIDKESQARGGGISVKNSLTGGAPSIRGCSSEPGIRLLMATLILWLIC